MSNIEFKTVTVNNAALAETLGVAEGAKVRVECRDGVPLTREWRNRFKDAEVDGCITVAQTKTSKGAR